jgi:hypothetical protein
MLKKNSTGTVKTAAVAFKGEEVAFSPGEKIPEPPPQALLDVTGQ